MEKKSHKRYREGSGILNDTTSVGSVYNITESVKNIKKLYEMSNLIECNLTDILLYYGEKGLSVEDIGILANIPKQKIKNIMSQGEQDYELGKNTVEADYYRAYSMGLKLFEIETSNNASKKDPMKMLAVINPTKYSDKVTDKYELPTINICFGGKKSVIEDDESECDD